MGATGCHPSLRTQAARPTPCAGHRLVESGRSVLSYRLVQDRLAAKRDLDLPRLRKLDNFDFLLVDDLGHREQTSPGERYEPAHWASPRNIVISQWDPCRLRQPLATAAAIGRPSIILEFDVPSYRTGAAQQRLQQEVDRQE